VLDCMDPAKSLLRLARPRRGRHRRPVTLIEKQQQLTDDLLLIDDPQERLGFIVDRARQRPALDASERTDAHRVRGCISLAWVVGEYRDGRCRFRSDADSPLVRGLLGLLDDLYSGATPAEIVATEPELLEKLGLTRTLSPTRLNGLRSVRARIRDYAASCPTSGPGNPGPLSPEL